jgi:hypothetical protein
VVSLRDAVKADYPAIGWPPGWAGLRALAGRPGRAPRFDFDPKDYYPVAESVQVIAYRVDLEPAAGRAAAT